MDTKLQKKKMGAPVKMTETTVRKLEMALWHGFSISTACLVSGISRDTTYLTDLHSLKRWLVTKLETIF
jgi:hypothetical protein